MNSETHKNKKHQTLKNLTVGRSGESKSLQDSKQKLSGGAGGDDEARACRRDGVVLGSTNGKGECNMVKTAAETGRILMMLW